MPLVKRQRSVGASTLLGLAMVILASRGVGGQQPLPAAIEGTITTQRGTVLLPGAVVTLTRRDDGDPLATLVSDAEGRYRFEGLAAGEYRLTAALPGFREVVREGLIVAPAQTLSVELEIEFAGTEQVDVRARRNDPATTATSRDTLDATALEALDIQGDDFRSLLPILPGVVRGRDGRLNVKGGRPSQTGLQMGEAYMDDPSTGNMGFTLPSEAIESVDVLPNPYSAEYGRFSSGVTRIETRKGTNVWEGTIQEFVPFPCLTLCDGESRGIRSYNPRGRVSGPLIKNRLFLSQSARVRFNRNRVTSLPDAENDIAAWSVDAFTRLDATFDRHDVTLSFALFPRELRHGDLSTFNPLPVTADLEQRGYNVTLVDTASLGTGSLLRTTFAYREFDVTTRGQGTDLMVFTPEGTSGNFFHGQERRTRTVHVVESFQTVREAAGTHLFKAGIDLLHVTLDGTSQSRPVEVRRTDGSLAERIDFTGPATLRAESTDVGAFVQDGWRVTDRLLLELGLRVDRDGVVRRTNVAPRLGAVLSLWPEGRGVLRGGAGRFYDRTPLLVNAFEHMEERVVTRMTEGVTVETVPFANRLDEDLRTSSGLVWNVEYNHRITSNVLAKINRLERSGRHELLVEPLVVNGVGALRLGSRGASRYAETELTLRYLGRGDRQMSLTYVRSSADADLNAFDDFFGDYRNPIIRANQYAPTGTNVPNRFVATVVMPVAKWRFASTLEWRDGFPYSVLSEDQDFVGRRNTGQRFPAWLSLDVAATRVVTVRGRRARLGLSFGHVLNNDAPRDVQANLAASGFGTFHNSIPRRIGIVLRLGTSTP